MKVTAINTSPRVNWNTAQLVREAAKGAESAGAEVEYFDLYRQEKFTGCISCFGCKRKPNEGVCIYQDGMQPILQSIRESDCVIIGTPNYLGEPSAGFRAELRHARCDYGFIAQGERRERKFKSELGGGALLDIGVYNLGFLQMVMGSAPETFTSEVRFNEYGTDEFTPLRAI